MQMQHGETESKIFHTEGMGEGKSGSSGSAGETFPKTPPSHIPARPSNKSGGKYDFSLMFRRTPLVIFGNTQTSQVLHAEGILNVEKTRYHKQHVLGIQLQRITKFSMKNKDRLHHRYAVV